MSAVVSPVRFRTLPSQPFGDSFVNAETLVETANVQFRAHHKPPLPAGYYEAKFEQSIEAPNGFSGPSKPFLSRQNFTVQGPLFNLDPVTDIHSVFPAPGHSEFANTLPHIVFSDPILPWEKKLPAAANPDIFNSTPWLALLAFTEDELKLSDQELADQRLSDLGISAKNQGPTCAFETTAGRFRDLGNVGIPSALKPTSQPAMLPDTAKDNDPISCILLKPDLFKALFSTYPSGSKTPQWNNVPNLERYAYFAHIQSVHGHHMASTEPGDPQLRDHSLIMSHRIGVISPDKPTNVIAHLISLDSVEQVRLDDGQPTTRVGLVSLHSWTWMAIPDDHANFVHTMSQISSKDAIQPLRMSEDFLAKFAASTSEANKVASQRLLQRLQDGYVIKKHTLNSGEIRSSLIRGPLCAEIPPYLPVKPSSQDGNNLDVIDNLTGLTNVSYTSAWQLGRLLAIGDRNFAKSLLHIRGVIHSEAVRRTKEEIDTTFLGLPQYLKQLPGAVQAITQADDKPGEISSGSANAFYRWYDGPGTPGYENSVSPVGLTAHKVCSSSQYMSFIEKISEEIAGAESTPASSASQSRTAVYNETNTPTSHHWATVLTWILDTLFTGKIPLHYLVPDPESLPPESIRTFFVDQIWLECLVDGALSLANHLEPDDDCIKKKLKRRINAYLALPTGDEPDAERPRLPKWGFFIRSVAVSAFSDLRIEIPTKDKTTASDILLMQRVSVDVLMVLLDRIPGEDSFSDVILSRPGHQNGFALGDGVTGLTKNTLTVTFRRLPASPGTYDYDKHKNDGFVSRTWSASGEGGNPVFDWQNRTIIMPEFAEQCIAAVGVPLSDSQFFGWDASTRGGIPSSIIASQLSQSQFRLLIGSDASSKLKDLLADEKRNPWRISNGARIILVGDEASSGAVAKSFASLEEAKAEPIRLPIAALPEIYRPEVPAPLQKPPSTLTTNKRVFKPFPDYVPAQEGLAYTYDGWATRFQPTFNLFPLHLPQDKDHIKGHNGQPLDFVFQFEGDSDSGTNYHYYPGEIEILIPVRLKSFPAAQDAANRDIDVLFEITGDNEHLELPSIEPAYAGPRWIYDMRVVYGGYWSHIDIATTRYELETKDWWCSYLVIRARTVAKWKDVRNWRQNINCNFLLKGARVFVIPAKPTTERSVEIAVVARNVLNDSDEKHVAFKKSFSVHPDQF